MYVYAPNSQSIITLKWWIKMYVTAYDLISITSPVAVSSISGRMKNRTTGSELTHFFPIKVEHELKASLPLGVCNFSSAL